VGFKARNHFFHLSTSASLQYIILTTTLEAQVTVQHNIGGRSKTNTNFRTKENTEVGDITVY